MKAMVTGGSGFIGSHVVKALLDGGHEVAIISRDRSKEDNHNLDDVWGDIHVYEADLRNRDSLRRAKAFRADTVFHLGAYHHVGESWRHVEEVFDVNAKGTANIVDTLMPDGGRLVYVSSSEVYGLQPSTPWTETMMPNPQSPYAVAKYSGELYCHALKRTGKDIRVVRPFNVYGPGQSPRAVIPDLTLKFLAGEVVKTTHGEQSREFNYIDDVVRGIIAAAKCQPYDGPVNLACGKDITIADLVRKIMSFAGARGGKWDASLPYRPNEIWKMAACGGRAQVVLGWSPRMEFDRGLSKTVNWYKHETRKAKT